MKYGILAKVEEHERKSLHSREHFYRFLKFKSAVEGFISLVAHCNTLYYLEGGSLVYVNIHQSKDFATILLNGILHFLYKM